MGADIRQQLGRQALGEAIFHYLACVCQRRWKHPGYWFADYKSIGEKGEFFMSDFESWRRTPVVQEQRIVCAQNIRSQGGFMEGELGFSSCLTFPAHLRAGNPSMSLEISFLGWKFLLRTKSRVDRCAWTQNKSSRRWTFLSLLSGSCPELTVLGKNKKTGWITH